MEATEKIIIRFSVGRSLFCSSRKKVTGATIKGCNTVEMKRAKIIGSTVLFGDV
jgi:hypothetical protein